MPGLPPSSPPVLEEDPRWLAFLAPLLAVAASAWLAVRAVGPALDAPERWLIGNWTHPDNLSNHWLLAWVAEQLQAGGSLLHNDRYYWPVGDAPVLAGNGGEGLLYLPFHLLWGWPGGVPPYVVGVLVLAGLGAYALARACGGSPFASLLAVGTATSSPYVLQELAAGRFSQADVGPLLLALAAVVALLRQPGPWRGARAGALLGVVGILYWYYAWFGAMFFVVLWLARRPWSVGLRPVLALVAAGSAVAGPLLALHLAHWGDVVGAAEQVFPHPESRLDVASLTLAISVEQGREAVRGLPWTTWSLSLVGAALAAWVSARARAVGPPRWLAGGLLAAWALFFALSLGPAVAASPYHLVYGGLSVLRRFWWPLRHTVVVHAIQAVFAVWALDAVAGWLTARLRVRPTGAALAVGAAGLAIALTTPQLLAARGLPAEVARSRMNPAPEIYEQLRALEDGVVVEPPLSPELAGTQQHLIYQRVHGKRLLTGHALWVDRVRPAAWDAFVAGQPLLRQLQELERGTLAGGRVVVTPADVAALEAAELRWFSLNREVFPLAARPQRDAWRKVLTTLFGQPVLRSKGVSVWDAQAWTGATVVEVGPTPWPPQLQRPPEGQPLVARRAESLLFPDAAPRGGDPRR